MTVRVRYLPEDEIEKKAELLLAEHADTTGEPTSCLFQSTT